jgi:hypothetical protein
MFLLFLEEKEESFAEVLYQSVLMINSSSGDTAGHADTGGLCFPGG